MQTLLRCGTALLLVAGLQGCAAGFGFSVGADSAGGGQPPAVRMG